jgi:hypothetical protein
MTQTEARERLVALGAQIVSNTALQERDGKTYCNFATNAFAQAYGCTELSNSDGSPLLANDMADVLASSENFEVVHPMHATDYAAQGRLVIAAQKADGHGHVATVAPLDRVFSQKWSSMVPVLYNVGRSEYTAKSAPWVTGENFAFKDKPTHYLYKAFVPTSDSVQVEQ